MTKANSARHTGHCISCALRSVLQLRSVPPQLQPSAYSPSTLHISLSRSLHSSRIRQNPDCLDGDYAGRNSPRKWIPPPETHKGGFMGARAVRYVGAPPRRRGDRPQTVPHAELRAYRLLPLRQANGNGKEPVGHATDRPRRSPEDAIRFPRARAVTSALYTMAKDFRVSALHADLDMTKREFAAVFDSFRIEVEDAFSLPRTRDTAFDISGLYKEITASYQEARPLAILMPLKYAFYNRCMAQKFSAAMVRSQVALADFRYPMEWFPTARSMQRKIHLHVGPTNSGKTHNALKRLEEADKGVYASPLKLLAHEIFSRLNARGKACQLVTGDDIQNPPDHIEASIISCTVEMAPMGTQLDVAVIDEIQMISDVDNERGHAWTSAVIGIPAKEVHLCGEERAVPLIRDIAAWLGEELIIHRYERLSPLKVMSKSLKSLKELEKGDCIVAFSVLEIHGLRKEIELRTGRRVAVVYGSLPPETRAQQARLFNDQSNDYDFLVASDAVGMGLNLSIKRVIFESVVKRHGRGVRTLAISQIKQIAGRAGRYRTADQDKKATAPGLPSERQGLQVSPNPESLSPAPSTLVTENLGLVTARNDADLKVIRSAMNTEAGPLLYAGLFPTNDVIQRFCTYFPPGTPYSYVLMRLLDLAKINPRFRLSGHESVVYIADIVQPIKNLSIIDRISICFAPISSRRPTSINLIKAMATCVADQRSIGVLELDDLDLDILDEEVVPTREHLKKLESLHQGLGLYCWMSFRFPGVFIQRGLATHAKGLVEAAIDSCLTILPTPSHRTRGVRRPNLEEIEKALPVENDVEHPELEAEDNAPVVEIALSEPELDNGEGHAEHENLRGYTDELPTVPNSERATLLE